MVTACAGPVVSGPPPQTTVADAGPSAGPTAAAVTTNPPAPADSPAPGPPACVPTVWTCEQQRRFATAAAFVRRNTGMHSTLAVSFTDGRTGATWRAGDTTRPGWTASTIKLAVATDLLARDRAGTIRLSAADRHDMATMLNFSDETASDRLWNAYGGDAMLARFRARLGMTGLAFVPGFTRTTYWGFVKCTTDDLAALIRHVLTGTDPADRAYLVAAMRGVAPNQRWGVWAAGAAQEPGNKDGWSFESDVWGRHWVTDTVGFAGPQQRYAVAVMDQVSPGGSLAGGVHSVSDVVALLFAQPTPAAVTVPAPDG